jgi:hypothetical protein
MLKIILTLFISCGAFAQGDVVQSNIFEYTKRVAADLEKLKNLEPKNYFQKVDDFRTELEKYFDHKKRVCEGEFSTVILSGGGESSQNKKPVKLSKEERKLCFRELKALQVTFINNMYSARKRYLAFLHAKRIEELEEARENSIKSLQDSFNKKSRR